MEDFFFRKENFDMKVYNSSGSEQPIPNPVQFFHQAFKPYPAIMKEIEKQGFQKPSPIQCQSWPILMQGLDMIGIAQTGTGNVSVSILYIRLLFTCNEGMIPNVLCFQLFKQGFVSVHFNSNFWKVLSTFCLVL